MNDQAQHYGIKNDQTPPVNSRARYISNCTNDEVRIIFTMILSTRESKN